VRWERNLEGELARVGVRWVSQGDRTAIETEGDKVIRQSEFPGRGAKTRGRMDGYKYRRMTG
jgi:hypothetical protein